MNGLTITDAFNTYHIYNGADKYKTQFFVQVMPLNEKEPIGYLTKDGEINSHTVVTHANRDKFYFTLSELSRIIPIHQTRFAEEQAKKVEPAPVPQMPQNILDAVHQNALHIRQVGTNLKEVCNDLFDRAIRHDESKWSKHEFPYIAEHGHKMKDVKFGTPEYAEQKKLLGSMIQHHNSLNRHHPEHFGVTSDKFSPVNNMCLMDIIEMLADWRAAAGRNKDGSLMNSINVCCEKYKISDQLKLVLINTATQLRWV